MTAELIASGIARPRRLPVRDLLAYLNHWEDLHDRHALQALAQTLGNSEDTTTTTPSRDRSGGGRGRGPTGGGVSTPHFS